MIRKLYTVLIWTQGLYTLITALWAIIDTKSFLLVTGPKTDVWLVKTVSVTLLAIALALLSFHYYRKNIVPAVILGSVTSIGLAAIDFYYSGTGVISLVYAADGAAECVFFILWMVVLFNKKSIEQPS